MSIEDPRLSSIDNTSAADDFDSAVEQHLGFSGETVDGIEVAQAETPDAGRTDRVPAQTPPVQTVAATIPAEVTPNAENVVTLPAGIQLDNLDFQVDGANLVLVLDDGTEIVVLGGAANIPTFVIGDVELPQVALFAALEGSNINVAAGPDGTFSAQGTPDSSRNFVDDPIDAGPEDFALADLLGDTNFGDEALTGTTLGDDGEPTILSPLTASFIYDEAVVTDEVLNDRVITGRLPFEAGPDFGTISAVAFTGVSNVDEGDGATVLAGFTSGGRPITVTSFLAPIDGADIDFLAVEGRDSAGELVFTLTITNRVTGDFSFELVGKIEHPDVGQSDLSDLLRLGFSYTVTDLDGDPITGFFNIDIQDDAPTIGTPVADGIDEDGLPPFGGPIGEELFEVVADDRSDAKISADVEYPTAGGSLAIRWGADDDLKNEDMSDGNPNDDDPVGRTVSFTGLTPESDYDAIVAAIPALTDLYSDGIRLDYRIERTVDTLGNWNGGYQLIAFKETGDAGPVPSFMEAVISEGGFGEEVFIITLDPTTNNGSYSFQLIGNLDHYQPGTTGPIVSEAFELVKIIGPEGAGTPVDVLDVRIPFTATDSDGDSVNGTVTVSVQDDKPVVVGEPLVVTVDEDDIETGSSTGTSPRDTSEKDGSFTGDDWTEQPGPAMVTGSLRGLVDFGADNRFTQFSFINTPEALKTLSEFGLTSNSEPLSYAIRFGTLYAYVDNPEGGEGLGEGDRLVFSLNLSSGGNYAFNLYDQLDHVEPESVSDENLTLRPGVTAINFGAVIQATDFDQDSVPLDRAFSIQVRDDVPLAQDNPLIQLDDDALEGGNPAGPADEVETADLTGILAHQAGADGVASILWAPDGINVPFGFWFERSADGQTMTITQKQGESEDSYVAVFKAVITNPLTGAYEIVQLAPVKHPEGTIPGTEDNTARIGFQYLIKDGDGDVARGTISFNIDDDTPTVEDNAVIQLDDDALTGGNPGGTEDNAEVTVLAGTLAHSGGADGTASVLWAPNGITVPFGFWFELSEDGKTMTITQKQGESEDSYVPVFKAVITNSLTGAYEIVQLAPVKHNEAGTEDNAQVSFQYRVTDGDNDVATGTLTVNIDDDTPVASNVVVSRQLDDEGQTLSAGNSGANWPFGGSDAQGQDTTSIGGPGALFRAGADGLKSVSVVATTFAVVFVDDDGFARTEDVIWDTGKPGEGGSTVFTATSTNYPEGAAVLRIGADGSYSFTMNAPIAHAEQNPLVSGFENDKTLKFDITVTDGDGDTATGSLTIKVDDDTPEPLINLVKPSTLDDEALTAIATGNPGGDGDTPKDINSVSGGPGKLFQIGADGLSDLSVELPFFAVIAKAGNGFAAIEIVQWSEGARSEGGVTTFTATTDTYPEGAAVLIIRADGSYEFTLNAPVAHTVSDVREDNTDLVFTYVVTDGDGDKAAGALKISVDDDTPVANIEVAATVTLDDEAQSRFAGNDEPNDGVTNAALATGEKGALFTAGADGVQSVSISGGAFDVIYKQGGLSLTETVKWSEGDPSDGGTTTFIAKGEMSGKEAAVLKIFADGSYSFELKAPVVHSDEGEDDKSISIGFEVTDGDGDKSGGQLSISVNDDIPVAKNVEASRVLDDEAQKLFDGNNGSNLEGNATDVAPNHKAVSAGAGALFTAGADGVKAVSMIGPSFSVIFMDKDGFAQKEEVTWDAGKPGEGGSTIFTATSSNYPEGAAVLRIGANGSYAFTLTAPIAHPEQDLAQSGAEEEKELRFEFEVVDGDGDKAAGSLTINVDDDTPEPLEKLVTPSKLDDEAQTTFLPVNTGGDRDTPNDIKFVSGGPGKLFKIGADGLSDLSVELPFFAVIAKAENGFAAIELVQWSEGARSEGGVTTFTATTDTYPEGAAVLVIRADGSYEFTLNAPVVHTIPGVREDNTNLVFSYTVTDGDGDQAVGDLVISVDDDTPVANIEVGASVTLDDEAQVLVVGDDEPHGDVEKAAVVSNETNLALATGEKGALFTAGADGVQSVAISGGAFDVIYKQGGLALTESVKWSEGDPSDGGTTTFIAKGEKSGNDAAVLKIFADGSYSFELKAPVVHSGEGEDDKSISIGFEVTDGDGDKAGGQLYISVKDDIPFAKEVEASSILDDEAQTLFDGNNGSNLPWNATDVWSNEKAVAGGPGTLFNSGADGLKSVSIVGPAFFVIFMDEDGFAQQEEVTWDAGKPGDDGSTIFTATSTNYPQGAAVLQIGADGSYSFTMDAPIAHPEQKPLASIGEEEQTLRFEFTVVDGDDDGATGSLTIKVDDDTPEPLINLVSPATLDDEAQTVFAPANFGGSRGDTEVDINSVSGGKGSLFKVGADGLSDLSVELPFFAVIAKAANGLASIELVQWSEGERSEGGVTTFKAMTDSYSDASPAAVLIIRADGSYEFTLNAPVAHTVSSTREDNTDLVFTYVVTDGDGDRAAGALQISVDDDTPKAEVTHGGLSGCTGSLFTAGADGVQSVAISGVPFKVGYFGKQETAQWSRDGELGEDGSTTFKAIGALSKLVVATIVIHADGSYNFELLAPLKDKSALINFTVTDGDGDTASGRLYLDLVDNVPSRMMSMAAGATAVDPILLDLDRNGFDLSGIHHGVMFDINADGHKDQMGWTSKDAILALDLDGNGVIDNGSEIFTPDFNGGKFASGVAALASLDNNGDGKIDANDDAFSKLSVWVDANNNGVNDEGELSNLTDHQVASISLTTDQSGGLEDGQLVFGEGDFTFDDGSTGHFMEVGFDTIFGSNGDDMLHGGMGEVVMTGGAGADTFIFDAAALDNVDVADVITDFNASEGDVLDVTALLDSLLGEQASVETAASHIRATVENGNATVSVQTGADSWKDLAVLQHHDTAAIKVLFDDQHTVVTPHD